MLLASAIDPPFTKTDFYQRGLTYLQTADYQFAKESFLKAIEEGIPEALCELGKLYELGCGVNYNPALARGYYEQAAKKDVPEGFYALALIYLKGVGVKEDITLCLKLLKKAADKGYKPAIQKLSELN